MSPRMLWMLCAVLSLSGLVFAQSPAVPPSFPSAADLILVDAVVVDDGKPVAGLTREDFVLEEDGKVQEIATFEPFFVDAPPVRDSAPPAAPASAPEASGETSPPADTERFFAIVVDDTTLSVNDVKKVQRALTKFIEKDLREGDVMTLWTTAGDSMWSARMPGGKADVLDVIKGLKGRGVGSAVMPDHMSDYEAFWITNHERDRNARIVQRVTQRWLRTSVCPSGAGRAFTESCEAMVQSRAAAADADRQRRARRMLDTLARAAGTIAPIRGRKSLLFFSPGFVADPSLSLREVALVARESNTAVYFLDSRGLMVQPGLPSAADAGPAPDPHTVGQLSFEAATLESTGAQDLALETGGFSVRNTDNLGTAASRVAREARSFYLLGFYPPEGKAGVWRKLKVSVKRKGVEVRARRGYALRPPPPASAEAR